ncbi:hypothetical protein HDK90DRAFT_515814 [Phyllosticta capitalensis]|uniref:Uncharacterized protein n=1 Tax=Phyllosticta capitalensis TaxID=121624 RepID=A0ABR1Y919_9PEZI
MPVQQAIKMARKIFAGAKMLKRLHIRLLFLRTSSSSPAAQPDHIEPEPEEAVDPRRSGRQTQPINRPGMVAHDGPMMPEDRAERVARWLPPIPSSAKLVECDEDYKRLAKQTGKAQINERRDHMLKYPHKRTYIVTTKKFDENEMGGRSSYGSAGLLHQAGIHQRVLCARCCNAGSEGRPFISCRAIPGFFGDSCSNCLFNDETQNCDCSSSQEDARENSDYPTNRQYKQLANTAGHEKAKARLSKLLDDKSCCSGEEESEDDAMPDQPLCPTCL